MLVFPSCISDIRHWIDLALALLPLCFVVLARFLGAKTRPWILWEDSLRTEAKSKEGPGNISQSNMLLLTGLPPLSPKIL